MLIKNNIVLNGQITLIFWNQIIKGMRNIYKLKELIDFPIGA